MSCYPAPRLAPDLRKLNSASNLRAKQTMRYAGRLLN